MVCKAPPRPHGAQEPEPQSNSLPSAHVSSMPQHHGDSPPLLCSCSNTCHHLPPHHFYCVRPPATSMALLTSLLSADLFQFLLLSQNPSPLSLQPPVQIPAFLELSLNSTCPRLVQVTTDSWPRSHGIAVAPDEGMSLSRGLRAGSMTPKCLCPAVSHLSEKGTTGIDGIRRPILSRSGSAFRTRMLDTGS